jgi:dethiobiotin synthetase
MSPALRGLLVTGTDTGVGKTVVSTGLLRLAARTRLRLVPFKPAETGCTGGQPADAVALRDAAARPDLPIDLVCPHRFRPPVAPAAATRPGQPLTLAALAAAARQAARHGDALLIEGAGGLLTPYAPDLTIADLAARLGLPVILVARNALGTINHTALCAAELRRRKLPLLGIVLVDAAARPHPRERNAELIAAVTGITPGRLPRLRRPDPDAAADALAPACRTWLRALATGSPGSRASSGK